MLTAAPIFRTKTLRNDEARRYAMTNATEAFTLIELLVVVLIIGILAAVALPQYQKAVEKSRATQAITLLKSVYNAAKAYQLASGSWPTDFDSLAVSIPFTGWTNYYPTGGHFIQGRSDKNWSIQIYQSMEFTNLHPKLPNLYPIPKFEVYLHPH